MSNTSLNIIAETENWVAINKPSGLLSIPDREQTAVSLKELLQKKYVTIFTVHRLDRDTSGIIIFAKNEIAHKYLSALFEERKVEKYYWGIVHGTPVQPTGHIDIPIAEHHVLKSKMITHARGKSAQTDYEVLNSFGKYSLLKFQIHSGRTHQVRVHAKHIGHPIVCDELYGDGKSVLVSSLKRNYKLSKNELEEKPILARLGLHAQQLIFTDADDKQYSLEAELPKDMRALLQQLEKNK